MGFAGVGNGFGGELRRASEALPTGRSGGVAESASMPALGAGSGGPAGGVSGVSASSGAGAAMAGEEAGGMKGEAMEEEEL